MTEHLAYLTLYYIEYVVVNKSLAHLDNALAIGTRIPMIIPKKDSESPKQSGFRVRRGSSPKFPSVIYHSMTVQQHNCGFLDFPDELRYRAIVDTALSRTRSYEICRTARMSKVRHKACSHIGILFA
jgi:hypothetical protein